MAGRLILDACNPALDSNGAADSGASLTFYQNGTTTLQAIYADVNLSTPLANPLSCDAAGRFPEIFADPANVYSIKWLRGNGSSTTLNDIGVFVTTAQIAAATASATASAAAYSVAAGVSAGSAAASLASVLAATNYFASYAASQVGPVADGTKFSFPSSDGTQLYLYQQVSGNGEFLAVVPNSSAPTATVASLLSSSVAPDGSTLPSNPIWDYVAPDAINYNDFIPNRINASLGNNYLPSSRPSEMASLRFSGSAYVDMFDISANLASNTITVGVAGSDSATKAVRVTHLSAGGATNYGIILKNLPPGRWTITQKVTAYSGTPTIRWSKDGGSTYSNMALTTSQQTFSLTFINSAFGDVQILLGASPASDINFDVRHDFISCAPGSSAPALTDGLTPAVIQGPQYRSGLALTSSSANPCTPRVNPATGLTSYSAFSVAAAVKRNGATLNAWSPFISQIQESGFNSGGGSFLFGNAQDVYAYENVSFGEHALSGLRTSMSVPRDGQWDIWVGKSDATGQKIWWNGLLVADTTTPLSSFSARMFEFMSMLATPASYGLYGEFIPPIAWAYGLSDTQAAAAYKVMRNRVTTLGKTFSAGGSFLIGAGDSIMGANNTGGTGGTPGWFQRIGPLNTPRLNGRSYGQSGMTIGQMAQSANLALVAAKIAEVVASGRVAVFIHQGGTNDHPADSTGADLMLANTQTVLTNARNAGALVFATTAIATNPANGTYTAYEAGPRTRYNAALRAATSYYTALIDFDAITQCHTWNGANYADDVHPNNATHILMATAAQAAIVPYVVP